MYDLLALAFQTDLTRVFTFMVGRELGGRPYPQIGVPDPHHGLSHHRNDPEKLAKLTRINTHPRDALLALPGPAAGHAGRRGIAARHLAGALRRRARGQQRPPATTTCRWPSSAARAPVGRGGRHLRYPKDTPMTNLLISMLGKAGSPGGAARRQHRAG